MVYLILGHLLGRQLMRLHTFVDTFGSVKRTVQEQKHINNFAQVMQLDTHRFP